MTARYCTLRKLWGGRGEGNRSQELVATTNCIACEVFVFVRRSGMNLLFLLVLEILLASKLSPTFSRFLPLSPSLSHLIPLFSLPYTTRSSLAPLSRSPTHPPQFVPLFPSNSPLSSNPNRLTNIPHLLCTSIKT